MFCHSYKSYLLSLSFLFGISSHMSQVQSMTKTILVMDCLGFSGNMQRSCCKSISLTHDSRQTLQSRNRSKPEARPKETNFKIDLRKSKNQVQTRCKPFQGNFYEITLSWWTDQLKLDFFHVKVLKGLLLI